jgi:hypothetical protein
VTERVAALLVVPHGTHRAEPLAAAIAAWHPAWQVAAVWCGDPYLRPPLGGVGWVDVAVDEVALVAGDAATGEWRHALSATTALLAGGTDRVVVLWVGAVAVLAGLDALLAGDRPMTVVSSAANALPADGLAPTEADLIADGAYSTSVAVFGAEARPAIDWLAANLIGSLTVGPVLARAATLFGAAVCDDDSIGVGRWRWDSPEPALLDLAGYDSASPWTLDPTVRRESRIELLGNPARQATMGRAAAQLAGSRTALCLPGGLSVDATGAVERCHRRARAGTVERGRRVPRLAGSALLVIAARFTPRPGGSIP